MNSSKDGTVMKRDAFENDIDETLASANSELSGSYPAFPIKETEDRESQDEWTLDTLDLESMPPGEDALPPVKMSNPPPVPESARSIRPAAVKSPFPLPEYDQEREDQSGTFRLRETDDAFVSSRITEDRVLSATEAYYKQQKEYERLEMPDLEDLSLKLDPDKLPSLEPIAMPEPPARKPWGLLIIAGISAVALVGGVIAWLYNNPSDTNSSLVQPTSSNIVVEKSQPPLIEEQKEVQEPESVLADVEVGAIEEPEESEVIGDREAIEDKKVTGEETKKDTPVAALTRSSAPRSVKNSESSPVGEVNKAAQSEPAQSEETLPQQGNPSSANHSNPLAEAALTQAIGNPTEELTDVHEDVAKSSGTESPASEPLTQVPKQELIVEKENLTRDEVSQAMEKIRPDIQACVGQKHGIAKVNMTIKGTGRVSSAIVEGIFKGTSEGSCVARTVRNAKFPRFRTESISVLYQFSL